MRSPRAATSRPRHRAVARRRGLLALPLALLLSPAVAAAATAAPSPAPAPAPAPASVGGGALGAGAALVTPVAAAMRCATPARAAGFTAGQGVTAVAVGMAESGCTAGARAGNGPTRGCPNGSVDRGMWQINSCYHPNVSDACAYDAGCSAQAAYRISSSGTRWSPWAAYDNGSYRRHLDAARAAVDQVWGRGDAPVPPPAQTWPTVRRGSTGEAVRTVQYLLRARGHAVTANGWFGRLTESRVRSFQGARRIRASGVVGGRTWEALVVTVRRGSRGDAVRAVQRQLRAEGYRVAVVGRFGTVTETSLRAFQSSRRLPRTGVADRATWRALAR